MYKKVGMNGLIMLIVPVNGENGRTRDTFGTKLCNIMNECEKLGGGGGDILLGAMNG